MEEAISLAVQACLEAAMVQASLRELAAQPGALAGYCDALASSFGGARDALLRGAGRDDPLGSPEAVGHASQMLGPSAMIMPAPLEAEASPSAGRASSSQRSRKRGGGVENRVVYSPAPRLGNTEIPPEDGHTWRKYGQKEIYGHMFPRSYFRCTHQKLYECPAKKQVQRLDNDPHTYQVTYRGDHTCHLSSTAPSAPPPPLPRPSSAAAGPSLAYELLLLGDGAGGSAGATSAAPIPAGSAPLRTWRSVDSMTVGGSGSGGGGRSGGGVSAGADAAGPSSAGQYSGREAEDHGVVDLVNVMFNPGAGAGDGIDFIFSSEDKTDHGGDL